MLYARGEYLRFMFAVSPRIQRFVSTKFTHIALETSIDCAPSVPVPPRRGQYESGIDSRTIPLNNRDTKFEFISFGLPLHRHGRTIGGSAVKPVAQLPGVALDLRRSDLQIKLIAKDVPAWKVIGQPQNPIDFVVGHKHAKINTEPQGVALFIYPRVGF